MKILIADDNVVSRTVLADELSRWGYDTVLARDGSEALQALTAPDGPRLAILDWVMPELDGVSVCRAVRQEQSGPYRYILLLTGKREPADVIEALDAGADDFLSKPFDALELRARLGAGRRIVALHEQLIAAQEALRTLAIQDALTGLLNRRGMDEAIDRELARAIRERAPVGVVICDVDRFKEVNDRFGHPGGDQVLRAVARRLQEHLRAADVLGRLGGEEFLVLLPSCDTADSVLAAERLCAAVAGHPFSVGDGHEVRVTASFGVAASDCWPEADAETLVIAADRALYRAKVNGRNRVETWLPDSDAAQPRVGHVRNG